MKSHKNAFCTSNFGKHQNLQKNKNKIKLPPLTRGVQLINPELAPGLR